MGLRTVIQERKQTVPKTFSNKKWIIDHTLPAIKNKTSCLVSTCVSVSVIQWQWILLVKCLTFINKFTYMPHGILNAYNYRVQLWICTSHIHGRFKTNVSAIHDMLLDKRASPPWHARWRIARTTFHKLCFGKTCNRLLCVSDML